MIVIILKGNYQPNLMAASARLWFHWILSGQPIHSNRYKEARFSMIFQTIHVDHLNDLEQSPWSLLFLQKNKSINNSFFPLFLVNISIGIYSIGKRSVNYPWNVPNWLGRQSHPLFQRGDQFQWNQKCRIQNLPLDFGKWETAIFLLHLIRLSTQARIRFLQMNIEEKGAYNHMFSSF